MEGLGKQEESLIIDLNSVDWEAVFRAFKILSLSPSESASGHGRYDEWIMRNSGTPEFEIAMRLLFARFFVTNGVIPRVSLPEKKESTRNERITGYSLTDQQR